jgi:hypothetical protein
MIDLKDEARAVKSKADARLSQCEVMELRFFLEEGKILWIEPIDQEEFEEGRSQATGKEYTVDIVKDLKGQNVRYASPVAFQQDSPACSFWWIYVDAAGNIQKICLA